MNTDMTIMTWHQMQLGLDPENEYPDIDIQVLAVDIDGSYRVVEFNYYLLFYSIINKRVSLSETRISMGYYGLSLQRNKVLSTWKLKRNNLC